MIAFGTTLRLHTIFEVLAYMAGYQAYRVTRQRYPAPAVHPERDLWVLAACAVGALIGSKVLAGLEWPAEFWARRHTLAAYAGGKTIVGGLLGGWAAVELAKLRIGERASTGDAFVLPLTVGICIGRIGCFCSGVEDRTCGIATTLPWGVDFGDGVLRHPAQIYEIVYVASIGILLTALRSKSSPRGALFRGFLLAYLIFRFGIDFIKPRHVWWAGLSAIQSACLAGGIVCIISLRRIFRTAVQHEDIARHGGAPV